jgi:hypothetical protein
MGRWYHGNIHGKFWGGTQTSDAMENYGAVQGQPEYMFKVCCCSCCDGEASGQDYCESCYESYEDHIKEVRDEWEDDSITECFQEDGDNGNWEYDRDTFERQGLPFIQEHEELFNKYIESITFDEDNDYLYEIEWTKEEYETTRSEDDILLADLCMLKQIQHFFEKEDEDTCSWSGEC